MSYVTQNFEDGKVLKAEHLNYIERNLVGISKNSDKVPGKANAFVSEASGDIVAFYPDEGSPLGVTSHIEPVQSGSGDPSPDNIRAITGFDSATLTRCRKNLLDYKKIRGYTTGIVYEISDNSIRIYTTVERTWAGVNYAYFVAKKGVTYRLSLDMTAYTSGLMCFCLRNEKSQIVKSVTGTNPGHYTFEYTSTEDKTVFPSIMVCNGDTITMGDITFASIQMEIGGSFTEYEPYQGDTFSADFGQTVYGGTLDWNTGVLTINKKLYTFNGTESFSKMSSAFASVQEKSSIFFYAELKDSAALPWTGSICSHFTNAHAMLWQESYDGVTGVYTDNNSTSGVYYNKYFRWGTGSSTIDDFKAFLAAQYAAGTPVQLCYEIAEPITIQLTPQEILALKGGNTVYTNAGPVTVEYNKSLVRVVEELTNAIVALGGNI